MHFPRAFHTSVVLPDGTVLIMGGQPHPVPFSDWLGVLAAELWDPASEEFSVLAEVLAVTIGAGVGIRVVSGPRPGSQRTCKATDAASGSVVAGSRQRPPNTQVVRQDYCEPVRAL